MDPFVIIDPDPVCEPPFVLVNLQCIAAPTAATTTTTTTTSTSTTILRTTTLTTATTMTSASTTSSTQPTVFNNPTVDSLLKALELCNSVGGFVPFNLLSKSQISGEHLLNKLIQLSINSILRF